MNFHTKFRGNIKNAVDSGWDPQGVELEVVITSGKSHSGRGYCAALGVNPTPQRLETTRVSIVNPSISFCDCVDWATLWVKGEESRNASSLLGEILKILTLKERASGLYGSPYFNLIKCEELLEDYRNLQESEAQLDCLQAWVKHLQSQLEAHYEKRFERDPQDRQRLLDSCYASLVPVYDGLLDAFPEVFKKLLEAQAEVIKTLASDSRWGVFLLTRSNPTRELGWETLSLVLHHFMVKSEGHRRLIYAPLAVCEYVRSSGAVRVVAEAPPDLNPRVLESLWVLHTPGSASLHGDIKTALAAARALEE